MLGCKIHVGSYLLGSFFFNRLVYTKESTYKERPHNSTLAKPVETLASLLSLPANLSTVDRIAPKPCGHSHGKLCCLCNAKCPQEPLLSKK